MKLDLSQDQTLLKDTVARLFADASAPADIRKAEEAGGFDPELWGKVCELGIAAMRMVSPDDGGSSLMDAAIVAEEAGRHLPSAPLIEAIVANGALARLGGPAGNLQSEVEGGAVATLALSPFSALAPQVVPWGACANLILGLDGDDLVALRRDGSAQPQTNIADANAVVMAGVDGASGERIVLARGDAARKAYESAVEEWKLLTASYLAGLGRRALELAAEYACERRQFGQQIGTFQGVSHPLADADAHVDASRLLTRRAIWSISAGRDEAAGLSALAFWFACQAADPACHRALRTFGGYGLTMEYDVQLYYRRMKYLTGVAGPADNQLDIAAARIWGGAAASLPDAGPTEMDFGFGDKAEAYAREVRDWIAANITPDVEAKKHHSTSTYHPEFYKKLVQAGHAYPDMPLPGKPVRSRYEVMEAARIWEDMNWSHTNQGVTEFVLKMSDLWSQPEAKEEIMSAILAGDALGCLGFSEPGSGSDTFAAKFSAVKDGDEWVLNGQKMFTTQGHLSSYILLLTRTDNSGKKHQGLTMFIVPMKVKGVEVHPVYTLQDERTNIVYFTDVRVSDKYRLGEVNDGARVMASALKFEHGGSNYHYAQTTMIKHAANWALRPDASGKRPFDREDVRRTLARAAANEAAAESLCRREVWATAEGVHSNFWGQMSKVFSTETMAEDGAKLVQMAAPMSLVRGLDHDLDMVEITMRRAIGMTLYGGTSEVHRSVIAEKSLGLPKTRMG